MILPCVLTIISVILRERLLSLMLSSRQAGEDQAQIAAAAALCHQTQT